MRLHLLSVLCLFAAGLGGCSGFEGEWLEDRSAISPGAPEAVAGARRTALEFTAPSTVRLGIYAEEMRVVDDVSVQSDGYFLFDGWRTAQFGEMIARRDGDRMVTMVNGGEQRQFTRVRGKSIFPPRAKLPPF